MTDSENDTIARAAMIFGAASGALHKAAREPHGTACDGETRTLAGKACVDLCQGDQDKARTLWKLIQSDLGYVPHAAAVALIRAAHTNNLVPDAEAPVPQ